MSHILALAFIVLAYFCFPTKAQFNPATVALVAKSEAIELFTSGHQAVFQFDPLSNRSWNIYEKFDGLHDRDHNFPMSRKSQFRIGSNSKTFTTIAILQLHEGGKLDIDHNVSRYLTATDLQALGVNGTTYCPVLYNVTANSPGTECQTLTFRNLLEMRSGLISSWTCPYEPESVWQRKYCQESYYNYVWFGSTAHTVSAFINNPLDAEPGSTFFYSNDNQLFLSYFIEKISGMKLEQYFSKYIFQPLGMNDTFLDSLDGELSSQKNFISGYFDYSDLTITPDGTPFAYGRILPTEGNQGALSGSGGVVSTAWDMAKFYASFFLAKNVSIISDAHREEMITPSGISGDYEKVFSIGVCETWGLGMNMLYDACEDPSNPGIPTCDDACLDIWTKKDRILAFYMGQVKAFTFTVTYGENWTVPNGARFISVATRNNVVLNTTKSLYNSAKTSIVGTLDQLTVSWDKSGSSLFTSFNNFYRAYSGGYYSSGESIPSSGGSSNDLGNGEIVGIILAAFFGSLFLFKVYTWTRGTIESSKRDTMETTMSPMRKV